MKYIKKCPNCGQKIRFPLDKGKIKIKCSCNHTLLVNPDDTTLYSEGIFDLSENNNQNFLSKLKFLLNQLRKKLNKKDVINYLLKIKYKIQNIHLLPNKERRRILFVLFIFFAHIVGFILFYMFSK